MQKRETPAAVVPVSNTQIPATPAHTAWHIDCPACAASRDDGMQNLSPDLTFNDAFAVWMSWRELEAAPGLRFAGNPHYLSARSIRDLRCCGRALALFFGRLRLGDIGPGHLREYQRGRALCDPAIGKWAKPCGANRIRKEVAILKRVLRDARLWGSQEEALCTSLRPVESDVQRAMTPEEQARFLAIAASREEWQIIHWYAVLALQTTASTNELRSLKVGDVLMGSGVIQIRREGAKNRHRIRTIPLATPEVVWAVERLLERARTLGATGPHHYLFPVREARNHYNPLFPMTESGIKKRFAAVRAAAGVPWLRPYDLRHTAITRMAEAGTPIDTIMSFAGHMTMRMHQHYTSISMASRQRWAQAVWGVPARPEAAPSRKGPQRVDQFGNGFQQKSG